VSPSMRFHHYFFVICHLARPAFHPVWITLCPLLRRTRNSLRRFDFRCVAVFIERMGGIWAAVPEFLRPWSGAITSHRILLQCGEKNFRPADGINPPFCLMGISPPLVGVRSVSAYLSSLVTSNGYFRNGIGLALNGRDPAGVS